MLEQYIKESWDVLRRNTLDVALDPKVSVGKRTFLYIPFGEDPGAINAMIAERHKMSENLGAIEVRALNEELVVTDDHGILYLPYDYIVPGGRFNEMYAWDSYWIIEGLLQDGRAPLARGIVENFIYQINHYGGKVLNANRTYYLSRSQPPMLGSMALAILPTLQEGERSPFLKRVAAAIAHEYEAFWKKCRYHKERGLFHYGNIDQGALGLCPEVTFGERDDKGLSHYDKVAVYLHGLAPDDPLRLRFFDAAGGGLTPEAIAGDRAMRESGFDTSMQMGYYGLETMDYNPVCLNSLLYMQCQILGAMYNELGEASTAAHFQKEALALSESIQKFMWNEKTGLFGHYNHLECRISPFLYLTSAYPLWSGLATREQAERFRNNLHLFETDFGMQGTDQQTGCQWDAPFMWAPLVYFVVAGLDRYGYRSDARRIAKKFIDTVRGVYDVTGANFEKYNAITGDRHTEGIIDVGYSENVVGFGWTNGAVAKLANWLHNTDPECVAVKRDLETTLVHFPHIFSQIHPVKESHQL